MTTITTKIYSLEPVLEVNHLEETLKYYQDVLGFSVDWIWPNEGLATHASVSFGLGHGSDDHDEDHDDHHIHIQLTQAEEVPVATSGWLYLRVNDNIDKLYEDLISRGANVTSELEDRTWGMREFDIKDINNHHFRFGLPISK